MVYFWFFFLLKMEIFGVKEKWKMFIKIFFFIGDFEVNWYNDWVFVDKNCMYLRFVIFIKIIFFCFLMYYIVNVNIVFMGSNNFICIKVYVY